jgi:hypothetical protein
MDKTTTYKGSCHCGTVRFTVAADLGAGAGRCNCSICTKVAQTGGIVKPAAFGLVSGEEALGAYSWGARVSTRFFCKHCGVHCFGRGHLAVLGGDFVSVNYNCLDEIDPASLRIHHWDGRHDNWSAGPRAQPWPLFTDGAASSVEVV